MKKNHWIWMIIGCGIPLLFIFLAPSFGIGGGSSLFIFIILMFAVHLFMPHGSHGHGGDKNDSQNHSGHNHNGHDHSKEESTEKPIKTHKGHQHH